MSRERIQPAYAVLCRAGTGLGAGAALALALRRGWRSRVAVVLHWTAEAREVAPRVLARPAARRLAASLRGRGHRAWASGRLVFVALPEGAAEAATEAVAAAACVNRAVAGAPCVLVLAGPRPAAVEDLLALQDGVVIVPPDGDDAGLAALAASSLAETGVGASVISWPLSGLARAGAVTGVGLTPGARHALAGAIGDRW